MSARPGRFIEIIETGWPRERDTTIVGEAAFRRNHRPAVGAICAANRSRRSVIPASRNGRAMTARMRMTRIGLIRLAVVAASIARAGTCLPPRPDRPSHRHSAVGDGERAGTLLASGSINAEIERTLGMIALVIAISIVLGFAIGLRHSRAAARARGARSVFRHLLRRADLHFLSGADRDLRPVAHADRR